MRPVISMVPSWTETLLAAGAYVVGRTRFCIHPHEHVTKISLLGGTKTLASDAREKIAAIQTKFPLQKPLVILDKEENPKSFLEFFFEAGCDVHVTHVSTLGSLATDLEALAAAFVHGSNVAPDDVSVARQLSEFSKRTRQLMTDFSEENVASPSRSAPNGALAHALENFKHAILHARETPDEIVRLILETDAPVFYFIWRNPWMAVSLDTWIGETFKTIFANAVRSSFEKRFLGGVSPSENSKYPALKEDEIPEGAILLFSSEPYPFAREWEGPKSLLELPFVTKARATAILDGEVFSWFGIRSIRFLEGR